MGGIDELELAGLAGGSAGDGEKFTVEGVGEGLGLLGNVADAREEGPGGGVPERHLMVPPYRQDLAVRAEGERRGRDGLLVFFRRLWVLGEPGDEGDDGGL